MNDERNGIGSPLDVFRLVPEGDPGTDLPGKSGTVRVRLSRVRAPVATVWLSAIDVVRSASVLLLHKAKEKYENILQV